MDTISIDRRSKNMAAIKGTNTKPEVIVRKILYAAGYRYRLHVKDIPGKPDIVLLKYNLVIFIHGCFWHQHPNCKDANIPKSNSEFWINKLSGNVERDIKIFEKLNNMSYNTLTLWQCEIMIKGSKKIKIDEIIEKLSSELFIDKKLVLNKLVAN